MVQSFHKQNSHLDFQQVPYKIIKIVETRDHPSCVDPTSNKEIIWSGLDAALAQTRLKF